MGTDPGDRLWGDVARWIKVDPKPRI